MSQSTKSISTKFLLILSICTLLLTSTFVSKSRAQEIQVIPPLTSLINDQTGTLSASEIAQLDAKLKAFEKEKGSQIAVLMINSTVPEDMFSYSHRAAETYQLGRKNIGDGVLLVVAKNDRKMHIYVMRDLEGAIPDIAAKRIITEQLKPAFAAGQFALGIDTAITQLIKLISGEQLPHPQENWQNNNQDESLFSTLIILTLAISFMGSNIAKATSRWLIAPLAAAAASFISFNIGAGFLTFLVALIVLLAISIFGKHYTQLATHRRDSSINRSDRNSDVFWGGGFDGIGGDGRGSGGWGGSGGGGNAGGGGAGGSW